MGQKIVVMDPEELMYRFSELLDNKIAELAPLFRPSPEEQPPDLESEFIDAKEVGKLCKYSVAYVYELARKKKIPVVPVHNSRTLRFLKSEIIAWIKAGRPSIIELGMKQLEK